MRLSACVMTKNSMRTLPACLDSIEPFVDEVIVVDDRSTDGTWEYLQRRAGKIRPLTRELDTFAGQRRFMCGQASGEWLLVVDADEEALPGLGDEVRRVVDSNPEPDAFHVPQQNVLPAHWPRPVHFWTSQKRLLRNGKVAWPDADWVHTPVTHAGRAGRLRHGLRHRSYDSVMHLLKKQLYYGQSGAKHYGRRGKRSSYAIIVAKTLFAFAKYFVLKGLFRFGAGGFVVAFSLAFYDFAKYALLWEQNAGLPEAGRSTVPGER